MCPAVTPTQHVPRHRQHVAPLFERAAGRDERAAFLAGFDHDHGARQPADDPVTQWKEPRLRRRSRYELADDRARLVDLLRERPMLGRIHDVDARPEHRDRDAGVRERTTMRRGIDTPREAADDDETAGGKIAGEL